MTAQRIAPAHAGPEGAAAETLLPWLAATTPIGLTELDAGFALQQRTDRKYFLPAALVAPFLGRVGDGLRVLDIDGLRVFGYASTYFDSADLVTYRAHLQGRRRRFKVRVRTYTDSGLTALEVKLKGARGETVKHRRPHPEHQRGTLTRDGHTFVAGCVADAYGLPVPRHLEPVLTTTNHRVTFASTGEDARMTFDLGVTCRDGQDAVRLDAERILVETKSGAGAGTLDLALRELGVRPVSVSKYCLGVAVLRPGLAGNPWHRVLREQFHPVPVQELS